MTTRPITDGDTKALDEAVETLRATIRDDYGPATAALLARALTKLTTRISEQEVELERYRRALEHIAGQSTILIGNPYGSFARNALTPTTQDQSEGSST